MNTIETKKLHWVFCSWGDRISYFLANENNEPLGCPMLRGVTVEEKKLLKEAGVSWRDDEGSRLYINCFPKCQKVSTVTAPAYIEVDKEKNTEYVRIGRYTDIWTSPNEIRRVNEIVARIIPKDEIHIPGCYVNMDN